MCWIDPFAPGSIFGAAGKPGVLGNEADYGASGSGTQGYEAGANMGGRDAKTNGVGHPNEYPETGKSSGQIGKNDATTTNYGLYFRSYTAGSLFPAIRWTLSILPKSPSTTGVA